MHAAVGLAFACGTLGICESDGRDTVELELCIDASHDARHVHRQIDSVAHQYGMPLRFKVSMRAPE